MEVDIMQWGQNIGVEVLLYFVLRRPLALYPRLALNLRVLLLPQLLKCWDYRCGLGSY